MCLQARGQERCCFGQIPPPVSRSCSCRGNLRQFPGRLWNTLSRTRCAAVDVVLLTKQEKDTNQWSWMSKSSICYSNSMSLLSYDDKQQKQIKLGGIYCVGYLNLTPSQSVLNMVTPIRDRQSVSRLFAYFPLHCPPSALRLLFINGGMKAVNYPTSKSAVPWGASGGTLNLYCWCSPCAALLADAEWQIICRSYFFPSSISAPILAALLSLTLGYSAKW